MKHLLNGVVIAAAFAIAAPAWANPVTKPPAHHAARHMMRRHSSASVAAGNRITDQLNRQELARIAAGVMSPVPPTPSKK